VEGRRAAVVYEALAQPAGLRPEAELADRGVPDDAAPGSRPGSGLNDKYGDQSLSLQRRRPGRCRLNTRRRRFGIDDLGNQGLSGPWSITSAT
jgi:hypothetical protein